MTTGDYSSVHMGKALKGITQATKLIQPRLNPNLSLDIHDIHGHS